MKSYNYKKAVQALNFFAVAKGGTLNKMKGLKLLFLADRLHLRKFGRTISGDTYFAFKLGPVASNTRDILDVTNFASPEALSYGSQYIAPINNLFFSSISAPVLKVFSQSDKDKLQSVLDEYGNLNEFELSELTHSFPEWIRFKKELERDNRSRHRMDFMDFFQDDIINSPLFKDNKEQIELIKTLFTRSDKPVC